MYQANALPPLQWHKHPGTNTWCLVINSLLLLIIASFFCFYLLFALLQFLNFFLLYLFDVCLDNYWHFTMMLFNSLFGVIY